MELEFITTPVITGDFKPKFYWTGNILIDAERINRPHIKKEGEKENRIKETIDILTDLEGLYRFTLTDAINIQNRLLKSNNWRGIKAGLREQNVNLSMVDHTKVPELINKLFPVVSMNETHLLEWFRQVQLIHPLSDLNGRVFGIIVSLMKTYIKTHPIVVNLP